MVFIIFSSAFPLVSVAKALHL